MSMNYGSFVQLTVSTGQRLLRQFAVRGHSAVAQTLLTSDRSVYDSFVDSGFDSSRTDDVSTLAQQLESLPDCDVMTWILGHHELELNSKQFQHQINETRIDVSVLVELFICRFSPECILKLVQDERLSNESVQEAVLFYFGHENEVRCTVTKTLTWKNQFIQYIAATPMNDAMNQLIDSILRRIDVNRFNGGSRANDGQILYIQETLLQMALRQLLEKTTD